METFTDIFNRAMKEKGYKIRSLEDEIVKRYGEGNRISKSLIGDYKLGIRAPNYDSALILADVLGVEKRKFLVATYLLKRETREKNEWERFSKFCSDNSVKVSKKDLLG